PVTDVLVVGIAEYTIRQNDSQFAFAWFQELDAALDEENFRRHGVPQGALHHPPAALFAPDVCEVVLVERVLAFNLDPGAEGWIGHDKIHRPELYNLLYRFGPRRRFQQ